MHQLLYKRVRFISNSRPNEKGFPLPLTNLSLLHIAAYYDALECFYLIHKKGVQLDIQSAGDMTPFHYSCAKGSLEVSVYILRNDMSFVTKSDKHYVFPPIYLAICSGNNKLLKLLLRSGFDLNHNDVLLRKPMQTAINYRHIKVLVTVLKNLKSQVPDQKDTRGYSPIMLAITNREPNAIHFLIEAGYPVNYISPTNETAISLACFSKSSLDGVDGKGTALRIIKLLLEHTVTVDIPPETKAMAAVHWICQSADPNIARAILEAEKIDVHRVDESNNTGPHFLRGKNTDDALEILDMLIKEGYNINFCPENSFSILADYALYITKDLVVIEWLLQNGADQSVLLPSGKRLDQYVFSQVKTRTCNAQFFEVAELFKKYRVENEDSII